MTKNRPMTNAPRGRAGGRPADAPTHRPHKRGTPGNATPPVEGGFYRAVGVHAARTPRFLAIALVRIYQYGLSPALHWLSPGAGCRFHPTCSEYSVGALREHGVARGCWLTLRRLLRCHPWGGAGYDPVPSASPADEKTNPPEYHPPCGHR